MRRGPKFEITQEMAVENIRTVSLRIEAETLTRRLYELHGSFSIRAIERKWTWAGICLMAGVVCGVRGSKKKTRKLCIDCQAETCQYHCETCRKRIKRQSRGMI